MADDVQILPGEALASAKGWVIPDALKIMPKSISAVFDGSGASGDFKPTLEIISDSGHLVARVPTETVVAAGDSAEVTFAPFLRTSPASTPATTSGVAWGYLQSPSIISLAYGVPTTWNFATATFTEDGAGIFSFDVTNPTELVYTPPSGTTCVLTIQGYARSTTNQATINPANIFAFLSPPLPDPLGRGTPNGVFSVFIDDQTPLGGFRQIRFTLIEEIPMHASGANSVNLSFLNTDPGMGNYDMRFAWLGATLAWSA